MKLFWIIWVMIFWNAISASAQQPAKQFYQQHKQLPGVKNFKVPGWFMWLGTGILNESTQDRATKSLLKMGRKVQRMRLLVSEQNTAIPSASVQNFVAESYQNGYEDLIFVRDSTTTMSIMGRIKKDKFKNITILVNNEKDLLFFDLKSNIRVKDIQQLITLAIQDFPVKNQSRKAKKEKRKKTQSPQA
jgi:hypothetical protein